MKYRPDFAMAGISLIVAVGTWFWVNVYVKPADDMRYSIMECMDGDNSRKAYDECAQALRPPGGM